MPSCAKHSYQVFVFLRDNIWQCVTQLIDDITHSVRRGERVRATLTATGSSQGWIEPPNQDCVTQK